MILKVNHFDGKFYPKSFHVYNSCTRFYGYILHFMGMVKCDLNRFAENAYSHCENE